MRVLSITLLSVSTVVVPWILTFVRMTKMVEIGEKNKGANPVRKSIYKYYRIAPGPIHLLSTLVLS